MPNDSEERIFPLDLQKEGHRFLLPKFSRWPVWKALSEIAPEVLPSWEYPPEPELKPRKWKGAYYAVWQYNLPQHFSSVQSYLKIKKSGGREAAFKALTNPVTISTGIKLPDSREETLSALKERVKRWPLLTSNQLTDKEDAEILLEWCKRMNAKGGDWPTNEHHALEVVQYRKSHLKALNQWNEDLFRTSVLWESISAAIAISWYIWNRYDQHIGGDNEKDRLNYLKPFFEAVGINVERVWKIAFGVPYFGVSKGPKSEKIMLDGLTNHYLLKKVEKHEGKLSKREREKRRIAAQEEQMRQANALESYVNERNSLLLREFELKHGKTSKEKYQTSSKYRGETDRKWYEYKSETSRDSNEVILERLNQSGKSSKRQTRNSKQVKQKSNSSLHKKSKKGT